MPVTIPDTLPALQILKNENIFIMGHQRANKQDIRPLRLAILNLMPTKIVTETQLLRLISNTALQVDITLLHMESHNSKNTSQEHLLAHYKTLPEVRSHKFDGMIITGAPVENLPFEEVDYWDELTELMRWQKTHVFSTFYICWGAQAGLYYHYGIPKHPLSQKLFGVFHHQVLVKNERLLRGFDDIFYAPHSRHTEVRHEDILQVPDVELLAESDEAGVYIVASRDRRHFFITGHSEYDPLTLEKEYERDINKGLPVEIPRNYYPANDPTQLPVVRWRSHANLLFSNWLNYYVYQITPYDLTKIPSNSIYKEI